MFGESLIREYIHHHGYFIEFDGYLHYTQSKTCFNDVQKDIDYNQAGYAVIRIPYFIQWCNELASKIFNYPITDIQQQYPHGFIDKKACLPADYCYLGIERFKRDLQTHSYAIEPIIQSLRNKELEIGKQLVLPQTLVDLL